VAADSAACAAPLNGPAALDSLFFCGRPCGDAELLLLTSIVDAIVPAGVFFPVARYGGAYLLYSIVTAVCSGGDLGSGACSSNVGSYSRGDSGYRIVATGGRCETPAPIHYQYTEGRLTGQAVACGG